MKQSKIEPVETIALPTHERLHEALLFIQDMLERSRVNFVLLGDTARVISSTELPRFNMDKIHVGVVDTHFYPSGKSMFKDLLRQEHADFIEQDGQWLIDYRGVPIQIDILDRDDPYYKFPDVRFYTITEFKLPNPVRSYLERFDGK